MAVGFDGAAHVEEQLMGVVEPVSRRVVVGVDLSAESESLLRWADRQAQVSRAVLYAVTAVPVDDPELRNLAITPDAQTAMRRALTETLRAALPAERAALVRLRVSSGRPDEVLQSQARKADLLVLGPRGRTSLHGLLLGSVTERLVGHAGCPVAVVHPRRHAAAGRIVVGLDGSDCAQRALRWAVTEAELIDAKVDAISVWDWQPEYGIPPYGVSEQFRQRWAEDVLRTQLQRLPASQADRVYIQASRGAAAAVLVAASADSDLIVVGNHGQGAAAGRLLGSVSQKVARHAQVPVIVVHDHDRQPR
jgi:nucleotide-binding universal stress UspA family protein